MKYIIANFKMNATEELINHFLNNLISFDEQKLTIGLAPGDLYLKTFVDLSQTKKVKLYAQNPSAYSKGPYTGQISCLQLLDSNIKNTLVGHSEIRIDCSQSIIDQKTKICMDLLDQVIICIGEPLDVYEQKKSLSFVLSQLANVINYKGLKKIIIAYEPIWAIGTNLTPDLKHINHMIEGIKTYLYNCTGLNIPILYGGSVNANNIKELCTQKLIDGFLIGNASLDVNNFNQIINACK